MFKISSRAQNILSLSLFVLVALFMPFIFAFSAVNPDVDMRIGVNAMYGLLVFVCLLVTQNKLRQVLMAMIILLSFAPNLIVQTFLLMDHTIMKSTDFWVVFNTDSSEAGGFLTTVPIIAYFWGIVYILGLVLAIWCCNKTDVRYKIPWWIQSLAIVCFMGISMIMPFRAKVPMIDFYKSFYKYNEEKKEVQQFFENRKDLQLDVHSILPQGKKTIVIVIGESQNREHMSLYGYTRNTNPKLTEIKDELTIYTDVCSPAIQTLPSMKQILTFSNYRRPDLYKQEASLIELLKAANYKVYWLDNQGGSKNGVFAIDAYTPTSYRTIAQMSDVFIVADELPDSVLIPMYKDCLADTVANKVIFLHLIGNHAPAQKRYESSFAVFETKDGIESKYLEQLNNKEVETINAYDNATLYNDYILSTFIEMLCEEKGASMLLYFSDHGEEVCDCQHHIGRSFEKISQAMCNIPLILWQNDMYKHMNEIYLDPSREACTDDIIYGVMDIAGIRYSLYDSTLSVFNSAYVPKERMVQGRRYDDIKAKFLEK